MVRLLLAYMDTLSIGHGGAETRLENLKEI